MTADRQVRLYALVTAVLMALLAATVGAAFLPIGPYQLAVALLISVLKAMLIVWFFMHVRQARPLIMLTALVGVFWLGILFLLALSDYLTRG